MNYLTTLDHEEFKQLYKAGKISVRFDPRKASDLCNHDWRIRTEVRLAHKLWSWVAFLMFFGGLLSFFFIKWYWAAGIFFFSFIVFRATEKSAGNFVIEAALNSESFYHDTLADKVLLLARDDNA